MYLFLMADLVRDAKLRDRFLLDAPTVLSEYGFDQKQQQFLATVPPREFRKVMDRDYAALMEQIYGGHVENVLYPWPSSELVVTTFTPAGVKQGVTTHMTINGQGFPTHCAVEFSLGSTVVAGGDVVLTDSNPWSSKLTCTVCIGTDMPTGAYTVTVRDASNPSDSGSAPTALSVSA